MAFNPKIDSPCPYRSELASIMDGDVCRVCRREVFDLSRMDDGARKAFLGACSGEVCVSYSVPLRPALVAAAMAVAMALPAAAPAQDVAAVNVEPEEMTIFVGGISDPRNAKHDEDVADRDVPELPVSYEEDSGSAPGAEARSKGKVEVSRPAGT